MRHSSSSSSSSSPITYIGSIDPVGRSVHTALLCCFTSLHFTSLPSPLLSSPLQWLQQCLQFIEARGATIYLFYYIYIDRSTGRPVSNQSKGGKKKCGPSCWWWCSSCSAAPLPVHHQPQVVATTTPREQQATMVVAISRSTRRSRWRLR